MRKPKKSDIAKFLRFAEALLLEIGFEQTFDGEYRKMFRLGGCECVLWKEKEVCYAAYFRFEEPNHLSGRTGKHNFFDGDPYLWFAAKAFAFFVRRMWLEGVIEPKSNDLLMTLPYWDEWARLAEMPPGVFGEVISNAKKMGAYDNEE